MPAASAIVEPPRQRPISIAARAAAAREPEDVGDLADRHSDNGVVEQRAREHSSEVLELELVLGLEIERHGIEPRRTVEFRADCLEHALRIGLEQLGRRARANARWSGSKDRPEEPECRGSRRG
jgi:hypothetical protein